MKKFIHRGDIQMLGQSLNLLSSFWFSLITADGVCRTIAKLFDAVQGRDCAELSKTESLLAQTSNPESSVLFWIEFS
jgi:hypothetical protein